MRTRKTIEKHVPEGKDRRYGENYNVEDINRLILEVLLDIRELLANKEFNKD